MHQNPSNSVYLGLPDLPALTFPGSPSLNPVADKRAARPGALSRCWLPRTAIWSQRRRICPYLETLASHGYIVASVEHTGNNDALLPSRPSWRGFLTYPLVRTRASKRDVILQRSKDCEFHHRPDAARGGGPEGPHRLLRAMPTRKASACWAIHLVVTCSTTSRGFRRRLMHGRPPRQGGAHGGSGPTTDCL